MTNKLPEGWEDAPLFKYLELVSSGVKKFQGKKTYIDTGSLETGRIRGGEEVDDATRPSRANMEAKEGDVLFAKMKDTEKVYLISKEDVNHLYSTGFAILRIKDKSKLLPKYIYFWLRANDFQRLKNKECTGATQKAINETKLKTFKIAVPPIKTQERIISLLEKAEQIKNWRKEADTLSKDYLKSVFVEMFGDPVKNPKNWKIEPLSDCVIEPAKNGFFAKNKDYVETGTPIIWIGDFIDLFYANTSQLKRVTTRPNELAKNQVSYGDVLFVRSSLTIEGIGKASLIPENLDEPTIFECHIIKIKLNVDKLNPEFFRVLSETPFFRAQIMKNSKTATMTTISQDGIMNNTVLLPPITIQLKFAQIAKKTLAINKNQSECKIGSDNLFNSMMQKAFKGELV